MRHLAHDAPKRPGKAERDRPVLRATGGCVFFQPPAESSWRCPSPGGSRCYKPGATIIRGRYSAEDQRRDVQPHVLVRMRPDRGGRIWTAGQNPRNPQSSWVPVATNRDLRSVTLPCGRGCKRPFRASAIRFVDPTTRSINPPVEARFRNPGAGLRTARHLQDDIRQEAFGDPGVTRTRALRSRNISRPHWYFRNSKYLVALNRAPLHSCVPRPVPGAYSVCDCQNGTKLLDPAAEAELALRALG